MKDKKKFLAIKRKWEVFKRSRNNGLYYWNSSGNDYIKMLTRDEMIDELIKIAESALGVNYE